MKDVLRRRNVSVGACVAAIAAALTLTASAMADTINVTRFSSTVSGTADTTSGTVTVNLLRNTLDTTGTAVRQQVDTFTATIQADKTWSGSFARHAPATEADQVEVNYSAPNSDGYKQLTIGGGQTLASANSPTAPFIARSIGLSFTSLEGNLSVRSDGQQLRCTSALCGGMWSAKVDGTAAPAPAGSTITFAAPVTQGNRIDVTGSTTDLATTVALTDQAPLPSVFGTSRPASLPPGFNDMPEASCRAHLILNEVICSNLEPGSFTLADSRTGETKTLTVPGAGPNFVPTIGGVTFGSLAPGDRLKLTSGAHTIVNQTVQTVSFQADRPFGDPFTGALGTFTGSCTPGIFTSELTDVCTPAGALPQPNHLLNSFSIFNDPSFTVGDDTSAGLTQVMLPELAFQTPQAFSSIHTPYQIVAQPRYVDPLAAAATINANGGNQGGFPTAPTPSTASTVPVVFSYAPVGSPAFTTLGNVNVPGGLPLPESIAPGQYLGRYALADGAGNSVAGVVRFNVDQTKSYVPPAPLAVPSCVAKSTNKLTATVAAARKGKAKKKAKKKKKVVAKPTTVTLTCSSAVEGGRLAVWLYSGRNLVADGSGAVARGRSTIALTSKALKKGTYQLVEVIDANGSSSEGAHTLTLR